MCIVYSRINNIVVLFYNIDIDHRKRKKKPDFERSRTMRNLEKMFRINIDRKTSVFPNQN